jgi:CubicO group peptidase (beta-lactamase class C family)
MKWSLVWLALAAIGVSAQTPTIARLDGTPISTSEIDATMSRLLKAAEVTGAAIAVIDHGRIAYQGAYGFRDQERNLPLTVDSVMSAASITKPAFAYLVMELVDEGLLQPQPRPQKNRVMPSSKTTTRSSIPAARASWSRSCRGSSTGSCERRNVP